MSRRSLLAAGGTGGFTIPGPPIPTDLFAMFNGQNGSGEYHIGQATFDAGTGLWTQDAANPVMSKTGAAWVSDHVKDPWVMSDGLTAYCSGYNGSRYQIGRATRPTTASTTWTYDSTTTPHLALGSGGSPDEHGCAFPTVLDEGSGAKRYKMWYRGEDASGLQTVCYAYSADGLTWTKVGRVLDVGTGGAWDDVGVGPGGVVKSGGTYYLYYAGRANASPPALWQTGLATFTDPEGTYTRSGSNPVLPRNASSSHSLTLNATTAVVTVASTTGLSVGMPLLIADSDSESEYHAVHSVDSGTQITLDSSVTSTFDASGGAVIRPFDINSAWPRSVLTASGGWQMFFTPFQPQDDLSPGGTQLREGSMRATSSSLAGTWSPVYAEGLLFPLFPATSGWNKFSSENPSVIGTATGGGGGGGGGDSGTYPTSLQDAIDATADGDTLDITGFLFHEQATIDHPMTLLGGTITGDGTRDKWLDVTADDVTIDGTTMTACASGADQSAGVQVTGLRFIGQNLVLSGGPYACLRLWPGGEDAQLIDCDMQDGPTVSLLGFQAHGATVSGGRYHHSTGAADPGNEAGGMKFGDSLGLTIGDCEADNNVGPGVWLDVDCDGSTIDNVHAHDNTRSGIHTEITDGVDITNCTVHRNCKENGRNAFVENGIFVSSCANVTITGCTVAFNNPVSPTSPSPIDIAFVSQNRSPLPHNGNSATGNTLRSAVTAIAHYTDWADTGGANTISPNTLVSDSNPAISGL